MSFISVRMSIPESGLASQSSARPHLSLVSAVNRRSSIWRSRRCLPPPRRTPARTRSQHAIALSACARQAASSSASFTSFSCGRAAVINPGILCHGLQGSWPWARVAAVIRQAWEFDPRALRQLDDRSDAAQEALLAQVVAHAGKITEAIGVARDDARDPLRARELHLARHLRLLPPVARETGEHDVVAMPPSTR